MKKIIGLLLTLVISFALLSCGDDGNNDNSNNQGEETPVETPNPTNPDGGNPEPTVPSVHVHSFDYSTLVSDETNHWYECKCGERDGEEAHSPIENEGHEARICTVCNEVYTSTTYEYLDSIGVDPSEPHNAYQVLVYSFYDSDGDGYGDLAGVEEKLDYIQELGIDIIWLSPIMESESYHAYDITSFYRIDPKIGTIDDYLSLVNAAHERNMKIMLDMPINHTSINHEWFIEYLNGNPDYAEYYQEKDSNVTYGTSSSMGGKATFYTDEETGKTYFAAFGKTMPDLNYQSDELINGIYEVFEYWMALGADGFRFDAVKHLYDPNEIPASADSTQLNNDFFQQLGSYLKSLNPNIYLLGENFSGQGEVLQYAESFDAEFDFESWHSGLGAVTNQDPWGQGGRRKYFDDTIVGCTNELISVNPNWIPTFMTGNHDVTRAGSYICDKVEDDAAALKLYAALVMLRSGIPFVYYGDELGMYGENKSGDYFVEDSQIRLPMNFENSTIDLTTVFYTEMVDKDGNPTGKILGENMMQDWPNFAESIPSAEQQMADSSSLFSTYQSLIEFRTNNPVISLGTMGQVFDYAGKATVISFTYEGETLYVAFNYSEAPLTMTDICLDGDLEVVYDVNGADSDGYTLLLAARGVAVFTCANEPYVDTTADNGPDYSTKYNLVINGSVYYGLTYKGKQNVDGVDHEEYYATGITLNAGDIVTLYDTESDAHWAVTQVNPYSSGNCIANSGGITVGDTGDYDIYVQFAWENDKIYFGPAGA